MQSISTRYLLLCTAMIAACLALLQIPAPPPSVSDISRNIESGPNIIHTILFKLGGVAFVCAISIFMHAVCSIFGLKNVMRRLISILLPTVVLFAYHLWWLDYIQRSEFHHPITVSPSTVLVIDLVFFAIGTAAIEGFFAILKPAISARTTIPMEQ